MTKTRRRVPDTITRSIYEAKAVLGELSPALIEEHYPIRRTGLAQDLRSLHLLLQLGGELAGAADIGDDLQGEGQVMAEAISVELRQLFDLTAIGLAHSEEKEMHRL